MIKIENFEVMGWEHVIRGMRNPMNSWDKSDTCFGDVFCGNCDECLPEKCGCGKARGLNGTIGAADLDLMLKLRNAGTDHRKFMRMIAVYLDVVAPMFWWKEFDTYKVGTVRNSCSTMHKIHVQPFSTSSFSHEGISEVGGEVYKAFGTLVGVLEMLRVKFNETQEKKYWRALIELLPESYHMRATLMLNYEVLANIYKSRHDHKLDEWVTFCDWIEKLPYSEIIIGEKGGASDV